MARGFRLFIYTIAILTWSLVPCTTMHATSFNGKQQTDDIEAMLGNETTFMAIQLDKTFYQALDQMLKPSTVPSDPGKPMDLRWSKALAMELRELGRCLGDENLYIGVDFPTAQGQSLLRCLAVQSPMLKEEELNKLLKRYGFSKVRVQDGYVTFRSRGSGNAMSLPPEEFRPEFMAGLKAMSSYPLRVTFAPPQYVRETFASLLPALPDELGGGATQEWLEGCQLASMGCEPISSKMQIQVTSENANAAQRMVQTLPNLVGKLISKYLPNESKIFLERLSQNGKIQAEGKSVVWSTAGWTSTAQEPALMTTVMEQLGGSFRLLKNKRKFREVALAIHNFESAFRQLPPAKQPRSETGEPLLSWRVYILPFLGTDEQALYQQFRLDEPWDSPNNLPLVKKMPDIYATFPQELAPFNVAQGYTTLVAPQGEGSILGSGEKSSLSDVTDGLAHTLFFFEVKPEKAVPWTAPKDYAFDPKDPGSGLAEGSFLAAMGDGSVQVLSTQNEPQTLLNLFLKNDGNAVEGLK